MTNILQRTKTGVGNNSKRHAAEKRFRNYGILAIAISLTFLVAMVGSITWRGAPAFKQSFIKIEMQIPAEKFNKNALQNSRFGSYLKATLRAMYPNVKTRKDKKQLYRLVSANAEYTIRDEVISNPKLIGTTHGFWVRTSSDIDMYLKGYIDEKLPQSERRVSDQQIRWIADLKKVNSIELRYNTQFLTGGDSREPEQAGVLGAVIGSALSLLVCFSIAFPIGVLAAVYLEEFAIKNKVSKVFEVNINNLAAVPSIVFGLLG